MSQFIKLPGVLTPNIPNEDHEIHDVSEVNEVYLCISDIEEIADITEKSRTNEVEYNDNVGKNNTSDSDKIYVKEGNEYYWYKHRCTIYLGGFGNGRGSGGDADPHLHIFTCYLSAEETVKRIDQASVDFEVRQALAINEALEDVENESLLVTNRGVWKAGTVYEMFDVVEDPDTADKLYLCTSDHTAKSKSELKTHAYWCKMP